MTRRPRMQKEVARIEKLRIQKPRSAKRRIMTNIEGS
jgi:hypothetical protein